MKLWLLRPNYDNLKEGDNPWEPWYDKCFGYVIKAETEEDARQIAHNHAGDENRDKFLNKKTSDTIEPWIESKYSTCIELTTNFECEDDYIIRDFASA